MAGQDAKARARAAHEEATRRHRARVRTLRADPGLIPEEYRCIDRRSAAERAADLDRLRAYYRDMGDRMLRDLDLCRRGSHQPRLL